MSGNPTTTTPHGRPGEPPRSAGSGRRAEPGAPRRRALLVAGLLLLAGAVLPALVVRSDVADPPFQGLDDRWLIRMGGPHEGPTRPPPRSWT